MPDYKKGKIYCIRSHKTDEIYIGSTAQKTLARRMTNHRTKYKRFLQGKIKKQTTSFKILEHNDAYIELICNCPCENKQELQRTEGKYIRERDCVNKKIAGRNPREYRKDNSEKIKEYNQKYYAQNIQKKKEYEKKRYAENKTKILLRNKLYREKNKDQEKLRNKIFYQKNKEQEKLKKKIYYQKNKEKLRTKYNCPCGGTYSHKHKQRHFRTKKHQKYIASLNNEKNNN